MLRRHKRGESEWSVVDLFSGAGGMSYGFHYHPRFQIVGAVDAQRGKPSRGSLQCNLTYKANIGVEPLEVDLATTEPGTIARWFERDLRDSRPTVLISCAPCTGFSRMLPGNHLMDDPRNSLVVRSALFAAMLEPEIFLMENARELITGRFAHHYQSLQTALRRLGYSVYGETYMLNQFGLPQYRERALVIAVREGLSLRTLEDLWSGYRVREEATHVRRAIFGLPIVAAGEVYPADPLHVSPRFSSPATLRRLRLIRKDGGSWVELKDHPEAGEILIPSMLRSIAAGRLGSYPDVYGRLGWDRPAVTIKRECAHVGNGRYLHPDQDRLCTVREMSILQGFPTDYTFRASALSNMYRHIGDAVPPLLSYQLARLCEWILTGRKPNIDSIILPNTHLSRADIESGVLQA